MKIPFSPPFIDDDVKREVLDALESGWITSGPKVLELEKLVAQYAGVSHAACCSSATAGLQLLLHWYGVGPGDEVIIPAYTYAATALVVLHTGAKPVMIDVGDDFNIDISKIESHITEKTKAIIPVDIAGWPCDYEKINNLIKAESVRKRFKPANENQQKLGRIMVLADAAHSIGATYQGAPAARHADFTVYSFHAVKNITTAEGGAICINLPAAFDHHQLYKTIKLFSLNGQTKDALSKTQGAGWRYDIVLAGFKMNMPDICAAIGLAQLRKYDTVILHERYRVVKTYEKLLSQYKWAQLPVVENTNRTSSYHLYALRINHISEQQRDAIIDEITKTGVSVNVHFQPLPYLTLFKKQGYRMEDFPVSFDSYSREISLPVYPQLDDQKIEYIVKAISDAYETVVLYAKANI
jgi:dTDP-4-amino-4,6-dideoxygalactose transaminase